jgi:HSP20 family molecular chaperone IbpA
MTAKDIQKQAEELETRRVGASGAWVAPTVDIYETDEAILVEADMPGVERPGVEVKIDKGLLTVLGRVERTPVEGVTQLYEEIVPGDFYRAFTVGDDLDESRIEAVIADGILTVTLPKAASRHARKIEVK